MLATPDLLWKYIIEGRFADFLRFFFRQYEQDIDFNRPFEFLDKELQQLFPESATSKRYVDKLVKVWLVNGLQKWVLVHVEVQGGHDAHFAARMYQYHYRLFDRYGVDVTSIAILTDDSKSWKPDRYEFSFMGTSVVFRFNVYKLAVQKRAKLLRSGNFFGCLMAAAHDALRPATDAEKLKSKLRLAKQLLRMGLPEADLREIALFIKNYWRFEDIGFYRTFDDEFDLLTNKVKPMTLIEALNQAYHEQGIEIGMEKGVQVGMEQGVQVGMEQGVQVGMEKGKDETSRMHIRNMFLRGNFTKTAIEEILEVSPTMTGEVAREMFRASEISRETLRACGYSEVELRELLEN